MIRGLDAVATRRAIEFRHRWAGYRNRPHDKLDDSLIWQTFDFMAAAPESIKLTFSGDYCYVYTNCLSWIQTLPVECAHIHSLSIHQAVIDRPRDQVSLLNPTHQYRTWFRERMIPVEIRQRLANWVAAQGSDLRLAPSFKSWLTDSVRHSHARCLLQRHFFIEHNSPQYETMLSMIAPGLVRKTQAVIQRTK